MSIHIQMWSGSYTARITDMMNAGKRGKTCRVLRFSGDPCNHPSREKSHRLTFHIMRVIEQLAPSDSFEYAADVLQTLMDEARAEGIEEWSINVYHEDIKAIKAPRPLLKAGVEGKWSAGADHEGVSLHELDDVNQWTEITPHDQSKTRAYELAANVWSQVQAARTMREASDILGAAGVKLHGYCGLD